MGNELVQYEHGGELAQWRDPEKVLAEATAAAQALTRVIALKKKPVMFNGEQYLEYEDWSTVGKFYGLTAKILETRCVDYGGVTGWEAVAVAINQQGVEVSRAESMCLSDEANWGAVPVYEWQDELDKDGKKIWVDGPNGKKRPKANKVQTGTAPKPLFQLRSMAQTRACAKAFRQVLSWVVVLGGFRPNVAEEMIEEQLGPEHEGKQPKPPVQQPQRASEKKAEAPADPNVREISGSIQDCKELQDGSLWLHIDNELIYVKQDKVDVLMKPGNILSVKAGKLNAKAVGDYWATLEVKECTPVQNAEDESQESSVDEAEASQEPPVPAAAEGVVESIQDLFDTGKVTTGKQLDESTVAKKEQAWKAHLGHDPAVHISFNQGNLLFMIQNGYKHTDETVKGVLAEDFGVKDGHRWLVPKDIFPEVLNALDSNYRFHKKK